MIECNLEGLKLPTAADLSGAFRAAREKFLEVGGLRLRAITRSQIRGSGMTIRTGQIIEWQTLYRGRGYAAVRPEASSRGANSPGAITNYLESGHRIRPPSGRADHYTPRIHKGYVKGFGFYASARDAVESLAKELAQQAAEAVTQSLGR